MKIQKSVLRNFLIILFSIIIFIWIGYREGREAQVMDLEIKLWARENLIVDICDFIKNKHGIDVVEEMILGDIISYSEMLHKLKLDGEKAYTDKDFELKKKDWEKYKRDYFRFIDDIRKKRKTE